MTALGEVRSFFYAFSFGLIKPEEVAEGGNYKHTYNV